MKIYLFVSPPFSPNCLQNASLAWMWTCIFNYSSTFKPLCAKYNIMHLVSNDEIKMATHRRNLAYYVLVLGPLSADERQRCGMLSSMLSSRTKLSTSHAIRDRRAGFSWQGERFTHSAALLQSDSDMKGCFAVCCHSRTFPIPLEIILESACTLGLHTPVRMWVHHCALGLVVAWALQVGPRV